MMQRQVAGAISSLVANWSAALRPALSGSKTSRRKQSLMAPPTVTWPSGAGFQAVSMTCPNCGSDVAKPLLLTIDFTTSPGSRKETSVLTCPNCTCPFYAAQIPPDYAEDAMLERGRVPFYLQQGAGISLITRPLAQIRAPAGSTYIEVGCGFGFGLDYANHAKGWKGMGIDPGGIAALGQEMLGVSIERRYLGDQEASLDSKCDVIMASETIEHVVSPTAFMRVLRSMLRPGGILVLTTPDGADLRPETAPGVLIGLLSPGLHLIFQTRESLHRMLMDTGFDHVAINKDGHSLVAFASDRPMGLECDHTVLRTEYRAYLESRSKDFHKEHDLFFAFAGRAFQEAVNDAAFDAAHRIRNLLESACRSRFGLGLESLGKRTTEYKRSSLEDLVHHMPLNLGGLLYADTILRLAAGTPRAELGRPFLQSAAAADLLRDALANLALADGMSEEIAWTARAEAVLCSAAAGERNILAQLHALPLAPDAVFGAIRWDVIAERTLVELVNAGHYLLATEVADSVGLNGKPWADPDATISRSDSQRDALFCLAVLDAQRHDSPIIERSRLRFHRVQQMLQALDESSQPAGLFDAALRGERAALQRLGHTQEAARLENESCQRVDG